MTNKNEIYTPTEGNVKKAENMMTDEQKEASEIRSENYEQEQPPWEDFSEKIDENFIRKPPSSEAIEKMDKSLEELGQVFDGSNSNWHLDGALNISLMNNEYIGEHKDVDISVEKDELEAIEAHLLKNGYGFFLSQTEDKSQNKIMRRVDFKDFNDSDNEHMLIAAIDENGKIRRDKSLNFVDVHIINRNEEGTALSILETPLPEKWTQPQPMEFHGKQINLSHPGKVLYYKLHQGRDYDATDAIKLIETGKITEEDIDDIQKVHEEEFSSSIDRGSKIFNNIAGLINSDMNTDEIFNAMQNQPEFKKRGDMDEGLKKLAEKISESDDKSSDNMLNTAIIMFGVEEKNNQERQNLSELRQRVKDAQKLKK